MSWLTRQTSTLRDAWDSPQGPGGAMRGLWGDVGGAKFWGEISGSYGRNKAKEDIKKAYAAANPVITKGYEDARTYLSNAKTDAYGRLIPAYATARDTARLGYQNAQDTLTTGYDTSKNLATDAYGRAREGLTTSYADANKELTKGYDTARTTAQGGYTQARGEIGSGYDTAIGTAREGYGRARGELTGGYDTASELAKKGYAEAQGWYETPEMVASRQELYNRILGKGGYSPETLEQMKAGAREEFGSGLRGIEKTLGSYYGDAGAPGLAGENLARAGTELAGRRATATRDIDIQNENLKRTEMADAIYSMQVETYQRAGLSAEEAQYLANLETQKATGLSNISVDEAQYVSSLQTGKSVQLAHLSTEEAQYLANLEKELGSSTAALSTEKGSKLAGLTVGEGEFLSNLSMQTSISVAELMKQQGLTEADLTTEEAQFLATIDANYSTNLATLSADEAAILAQLMIGKGEALASTRNTAGLMPLLGEMGKGVGAGITYGIVTSSRDAKENINPLSNIDHEKNLKTISEMDMVRYKYKNEFRPSEDNGKEHIGMIAEDAPEEMVITGRTKLNVGDMIGMALSAIKALSAKIDTLERK